MSFFPGGHQGLWAAIRSLLMEAGGNYFTSYHPIHAPEGTSIPFAVYHVVTNVPSFSMYNSYFEKSELQIDCYSEDADTLMATGKEISKKFDLSTYVPMTDGQVARFHKTNEFIDEDPDPRSEIGGRVFRLTMMFNVMTSREKQ